jgi:hypothetical protein
VLRAHVVNYCGKLHGKHKDSYLSAVVWCSKLHTVEEYPEVASDGAAPPVLPVQCTASACARLEPAHLRQLLAARGRLMQATLHKLLSKLHGICLTPPGHAPGPP